MAITTRSKIAVRYTTSPADMGYGGKATDWRTAKADTITSPAKALEFVRGLKSKLGGADIAVSYQCEGREVAEAELVSVVMAAECRQ